MIVEWFVSVAAGLLGWVIDAIPDVAVPSWLSSSDSAIGTITGHAAALSYWVPFGLAGTVGLAVLACIALGVGIKLGRVILSLFTAGGGSAG